MSTCGFTPTQIRQMEFFDVMRLSRYFSRHPPLRDLVEAIARSIGIKMPDGSKPEYMTGEAFKALVDATGGKIDGVPSISEYRG